MREEDWQTQSQIRKTAERLGMGMKGTQQVIGIIEGQGQKPRTGWEQQGSRLEGGDEGWVRRCPDMGQLTVGATTD